VSVPTKRERDDLAELLKLLRAQGVARLRHGDLELEMGLLPVAEETAHRAPVADPEDEEVDPTDGLTKKQKREWYGVGR
jgi:hypothetical protein